jgi:hypothetical protein
MSIDTDLIMPVFLEALECAGEVDEGLSFTVVDAYSLHRDGRACVVEYHKHFTICGTEIKVKCSST